MPRPGQPRPAVPVEYLCHRVAVGYQGTTWCEVYRGPGAGMSAQDVREAAAFLALDVDIENRAHEKNGRGHSDPGKPPKRNLLHRG